MTDNLDKPDLQNRPARETPSSGLSLNKFVLEQKILLDDTFPTTPEQFATILENFHTEVSQSIEDFSEMDIIPVEFPLRKRKSRNIQKIWVLSKTSLDIFGHMATIKVTKVSPEISRVLIETKWSGLPFFTPEFNLQEFNQSVICLAKLVDYIYAIFGEKLEKNRKNPLSALQKQKSKSGRKNQPEDVWAYKQIFIKGRLPMDVKNDWEQKVRTHGNRIIDEESIERTWSKISQAGWLNANELD